MTVKEVLTLSSQFLNKEDELKDDIASGGESSGTKTFKTLLNAVNIVNNEIASDYFPLTIEEEIDIQNNKIYYDDLSKNVKDIYTITSLDRSMSYRFKTFENYLNVFAGGRVVITYSYFPEQAAAQDILTTFGGKVSARTFALGVVAEYYFISGIFDEAQVWHKRFVDSINSNLSKKGIVKMPKRKWLWYMKKHFLQKNISTKK